MNKRQILKWWSVGAGSMDAVTGLLLIVAPLLVLRLLGIAPLAAESLIFLNWVGVFVLAVGLSYGLALTGRARGEAVWMFTGLVRILVAVFLSIRVISGAMEPAWLLVAASDGIGCAGAGSDLTGGLVEGDSEMNRVAIRAAITVASVYGFFLLFAQFAFVELIRGAGHGVVVEKFLLGAMAVAGVAAGFFAAWRGVRPEMIRTALGVAAVASLIAAFSGMLPILLVVSLATGAALGVATVSLAALLPGWCGIGAVAVGTGVGYALCNLPWVFPQSPVHQAWISAGIAGMGALAVPPTSAWREEKEHRPLAFPLVLILFTALVWMDSAAFFIIQHEGI